MGDDIESWVDIRRTVAKVTEDKRQHPRLEFHCPARIQGIKGVFKVTDISMGGAFLELSDTSAFEIGQLFSMTMKLPTEYEPINVKVKVTNIRDRGIGLLFIGMTQKKQEVIRFAFDTFKDTIPVK